MAEVLCEKCERKYQWKPALAGKSVRCKCGNVLNVPTEVPAPAAAGDLNLAENTGATSPLIAQRQAAQAAIETEKTPEKLKEKEWGPWTFIGTAAGLFALAGYVYYDLSEFERSGGVRYMNSLFYAGYKIGGVWGPTLVSAAIGLLCGVIGVSMLLGYNPDNWIKRK